MVPFLKQVAAHYFTGHCGDLCFVFPNRRSMVFFRKYLSEVVAGHSDVPVKAPEMYTINDFFAKAYGGRSADRITLLLELYGCYRKLNPKAESLDEFIFWGDILLGDFNDVDKYLADPSRLYANVADFKSMQDTYEYLTETQREAIGNFVRHFNDRSGRLTVDLGSGNPNVKERFLQIWTILYPLYCSFRETLSSKGLAYEGMIYRGLAERLQEEPVAAILNRIFHREMKYVFVGLNALNECEKTLMRRMRDCGAAEFCWDYSGTMIQDSRNKSSFFMSENVKSFPQSFPLDTEGTGTPSFKIISVPSSIGQVKQVPDILKGSGDFAIVLPDESLLMPLLDTIPPEIKDINVTMGYPMSGSSFYSMMKEISAMQLHTRKRGDVWCFYYRQVWSLFSNSIFRKAMGPEGEAIALRIKSEAKLYIPQTDFKGSGLFETVFSPAVTDQKTAAKEQIDSLASYQMRLISMIAPLLEEDVSLAVELEFAKEYYRCVNRLKGFSLEVLPLTYIRLLDQLLGTVAVPFKGEPLKGLQIMGPLETRALDFRNLVLLSANEGIFPKRSVSSSFIPPELRKGFGLPTYEYQDAVWAYYFYRMVTRAENVWIMYDSRTEGMKTGEESRYIKQLEYHFRLSPERYAADARARSVSPVLEIEKTPQDVETIRSKDLSATSIQNYIACPAKFYYSAVKGLVTGEEVSETMDAAMVGTVYHGLMQFLYQVPSGAVTRKYITGWMKRTDDIKSKVRSLMLEQLRDVEITGRNLVVGDVIVRYVLKTLERDLELMTDKGTDSFRILGLEKRLKTETGGFRLKGFIDRIDSFADGEIRVVDYKTGKVLPEDMQITDADAEKTAGMFFGDTPYGKKPKIAFQLFIYDKLLRANGLDKGCRIIDSVYSTAKLFSGPPQSEYMGEEFYGLMDEGLGKVLEEMSDLSVPFRRTEDEEVCAYCDFRTICGR